MCATRVIENISPAAAELQSGVISEGPCVEEKSRVESFPEVMSRKYAEGIELTSTCQAREIYTSAKILEALLS